MYNHTKAQQSKNRVHISWDILYILWDMLSTLVFCFDIVYIYMNEPKLLNLILSSWIIRAQSQWNNHEGCG